VTRARPPIDRSLRWRWRGGPALAALTQTLGFLLGTAVLDPAHVAWAQPAAAGAGKPAMAQAPVANEPLPRWDVSGLLGWRAVRIETMRPHRDWEQWFTYGGTVGSAARSATT
jgi:hypothetical protein